MPINKAIAAIKKHDRFFITSHINPEPDALGSELAAYELIKELGKRASVINSDPVPEHYQFLEGVDIIKQDPRNDEEFDAAIVLDCPNLARTGRVADMVKKINTIINIDHHISNEQFGAVNYVMPNASSTGEVMYSIYKKMEVPISKKVALYIYIAILTDTGSFNYSNTSGITHEIVSELLGYGIHPHVISNYVYENKRFSDIRLLGKVLSRMKYIEKDKISYMICTKDMIEKCGSSIFATENFINFARSIKGVSIAIFIREEPNKKDHYKISLRSKGEANVDKIAQHFGGGGHKHAAGCNIVGPLRQVKKLILRRTRREIRSAYNSSQAG